MVKKLEQGQKYPEGFTQMRILLKLCEKDRTPTSDIFDFLKDQYYIREQKNIREHHLKTLKKQKLIRRESAGPGHPDYWSVIPDFRVLKELVDRLKRDRSGILQMLAQLPMLKELVDRLKHDLDSQTAFIRSQYYQDMIPELVHQFEDSIPDNDLWKLTTYEHDATRDKPLSKEDEEGLTRELSDKLIRNNWIALKFVTHFISVKDDERTDILHKLMESVLNHHISPAAAQRRGYHKGYCSGMDVCTPWIKERVVTITMINDTVQLTYATVRGQAEMGIYGYGPRPATDKPLINWGELFHQLDHLNSNYPYLFD
jgi:hypothetical protein